MQSNLVESTIGAVVLFVAASFLLFVDARTSAQSDGEYFLIARFDDATGLRTGSDVRLGGIKVGAVTGTRIDSETYQAIVRFTVSEAVELPMDTAAAISSESLLGGAFLALLPGGDIEYLADGDEVEETQDAVDLLGLISKFAAPDSSE